MIINPECYSIMYHGVNLDDILVDTWYLNENEVCTFELMGLPLSGFHPIISTKVLDVINTALSYCYTFVIDELAISVKQGEMSHQYMSIPLSTTGKLQPESNTIFWNPIEGLSDIFITVSYNADVYDNSRNVVSRMLPGSIFIHVHFSVVDNYEFNPDNRKCEIHIHMKTWLLMMRNNDIDIMMIYLQSKGLVAPGEKNLNSIYLAQIIKNCDIVKLEQVVRNIGSVFVSHSEFEKYNSCSLLLDDQATVPLSGNDRLYLSNRMRFTDFVKKLEIGFGKEATMISLDH